MEIPFSTLNFTKSKDVSLGTEFQAIHSQEERRGSLGGIPTNLWDYKSLGSRRTQGHNGHRQRKALHREALWTGCNTTNRQARIQRFL